jgi:N-acetyl-alpha-D-muramate 1-phosphate uridylyltransferase
MKTAIILAAGRGERLRPLTDSLPKPMCRIHGIPLIEHHVANLAAANFERLIINHAHLGGQIRQHLGNGKRWNIEICYSPEPPGALESAGGIVNILPLLGNEPFVTVNADIFTDYNFASLTLPATSLMHLVLVPMTPSFTRGDFGLTSTSLLDNDNRDYIYAGISCYHPHFFKHCKFGRYSIVPMWREAARDKLATAEVYRGKWINIDSLELLRIANE